MPNQEKSWWGRAFGRSILSALFGTFFEKKTNTASIIAILLVGSVCYVVAIDKKHEYMNYLVNILFVVIGYYFGARQAKVDKDDD